MTNTWVSSVQQLVPLGEAMADRIADPNDKLLREEMYSFLYSLTSMGYTALAYADPEYPDFWPMIQQAHSMFLPNADFSYYFVPLDANGVYKVSGFRGTVRIVDMLLAGGTMYPRGFGGIKAMGPATAPYELDRDAHIHADGSFEVIISPERPAGYQGDWWHLPAKTTYMVVRQYSYDWLNEIDARLAIERLDLPAIRPRRSAEEIAKNLSMIPGWVKNWTEATFAFMDDMRRRDELNRLSLRKNASDLGGTTDHQHYIDGLFELDDDEALILETKVPDCRYWSVQLSDDILRALDPMNRQSIVNGHQLQVDSDGKARFVISARDPGVPNWLDTAGYKRGYILERIYGYKDLPVPTTKKVKVADVRRNLPADTLVVSASERDATIRLRRKGAQLRRRW